MSNNKLKITRFLFLPCAIITLIITLLKGDFNFVGKAASGESPVIKGDLNTDGVVNIQDAIILSNSFGKKSGNAAYNIYADINNDGAVNIQDAIILSNNFQR